MTHPLHMCYDLDLIMNPFCSGDLTDAKAADNMGSAQYEQEWINYRDMLNKCNLGNHTVWLDIRGNHGK